MNCPKCKSTNVAESTADTFRCNDCDYAWVNYYTAPRFRDSGMNKPASQPGAMIVLIILLMLVAIAVGFVSPLWALLVGMFGMLAAILYYVARGAQT